jgi:hypothetical protein
LRRDRRRFEQRGRRDDLEQAGRRQPRLREHVEARAAAVSASNASTRPVFGSSATIAPSTGLALRSSARPRAAGSGRASRGPRGLALGRGVRCRLGRAPRPRARGRPPHRRQKRPRSPSCAGAFHRARGFNRVMRAAAKFWPVAYEVKVG